MDPARSKNKASTRLKPTSKKNLLSKLTNTLQGKKEFAKRASLVSLKPQAPWSLVGRSFSIAVKFHILTCGAAALLILYTGRGRYPYFKPIKKEWSPTCNRKHLGFQNSLIHILRKSCQWCKIIYCGIYSKNMF